MDNHKNKSIKKLNIKNEFKKKLENLYRKKDTIDVTKEKTNKNIKKHIRNTTSNTNNESNIKKTVQPQQNVFLKNNLEEIYEINNIDNSQKITITIEISSYYQLLSYIFFSIFSACLSLRIMYILFLM
jgi:hypothetical protein